MRKPEAETIGYFRRLSFCVVVLFVISTEKGFCLSLAMPETEYINERLNAQHTISVL